MFSSPRSESKGDAKEIKPTVAMDDSKPSLERKRDAALPDFSQDAKASAVINAILHPPASDIEIDPDFCCPITTVLIREPVQASDGHLYEREAIEKWLETKNTSPATGAVLSNKNLTPNIFAKKQILGFLEKHPGLKDTSEWYLPQSWMQSLITALKKGDEKTIRELAEQDRRLLVLPLDTKTGQRAIHFAAAGHPRSLDIVVTLLEKRQRGLGLATLMEKDEKGYVAIQQAMISEQPADVLLQLMDWLGSQLKAIKPTDEWLLDSRSQNAWHDALKESVIEQDLTRIDFFLQHGANVNFLTFDAPLLFTAIKHSKTQSLLALLAAKANPNGSLLIEGMDTPLHAAVRKGDCEAVVALKNYGASLTKSLADGSTPLHLAAELDTSDVADALFKEEKLTAKELEAKDQEGHTPLHRAILKGQLSMIAWLLEHKAQASAQNAAGQSALHLAARLDQEESIMLLLKHNAELTAQNPAGNTALHVAAQAGARYALEALLRQGLSAESRNNEGQTARQLAEASGRVFLVARHDKIIQELREKEDSEFKALGAVGLLLLKQQNIIRQQQAQISVLQAELKAQQKDVQGLLAARVGFFTDKERQAEEASTFLKLVADGEQNKAEALLKTKPGLALCYSEVKDIGGRTFKRITAFQYAVWALDWHMWTMLLKYLPKEQAAQQFLELETKGTEHGKAFNLQPLIEALKTYVDNDDKWSDDQCRKHWIQVIGGQQRLLPMHVWHEYCHPDRSFDPCPSFKEASLPRNSLPDWLVKGGSLVSGLSSEWSVLRGHSDAFGLWRWEALEFDTTTHEDDVCLSVQMELPYDQYSLSALYKCRTEQREILASTFKAGQSLLGEHKAFIKKA